MSGRSRPHDVAAVYDGVNDMMASENQMHAARSYTPSASSENCTYIRPTNTAMPMYCTNSAMSMFGFRIQLRTERIDSTYTWLAIDAPLCCCCDGRNSPAIALAAAPQMPSGAGCCCGCCRSRKPGVSLLPPPMSTATKPDDPANDPTTALSTSPSPPAASFGSSASAAACSASRMSASLYAVTSSLTIDMKKSVGFLYVGVTKPCRPNHSTAARQLPLYTHRPLASSMKSSNMSVMSEFGWWMVHTTVRRLRASMSSASMMLSATSLSSPLVGSSAKMTMGSLTSSMARLTRRFCPPLMPLMPSASSPTSTLAHVSSSSSLSTPSTAFVFAALSIVLGSRSIALVMTHSRTVADAMSMSRCDT
mmetsp:Transcript_3619/g.10142  ORF Transcript_3619/g.10142 Transcript_3619/m.10142 type:complete len:364 (+) Transcript_3619:2390-3481(+)